MSACNLLQTLLARRRHRLSERLETENPIAEGSECGLLDLRLLWTVEETPEVELRGQLQA